MFDPKNIAQLVASCPAFTNVTWLAKLTVSDVSQHASSGDAVLFIEARDGQPTGECVLALVVRRTTVAGLLPDQKDLPS